MKTESVRGVVLHDADLDRLVEPLEARFTVITEDGKLRELRLRNGRGIIADLEPSRARDIHIVVDDRSEPA